MAWIEWFDRKKGGRSAYVRWRDEHGRKRQRALGVVSQEIAEAERVRMACLWEGETASRIMSMDAQEALDLFLADLREIRQCRASSVEYVRRLVQTCIDELGSDRWRRWRKHDVQRMFARLPNTVRGNKKILQELRRFLRWAIDEGAPIGDCTRGVYLPRSEPINRSALTPEEVRRVVHLAEGHRWLQVPLALAAYAGLSYSDFRALTWDQVDLDCRIIKRRRTKTGEVIATPLIGEAHRILCEAHKDQGRPDTGTVCINMPDDLSGTLKVLYRLQTQAGIPRAERGQNGWHRYRRSLATTLRKNGVSGNVIGRILGHAPDSLMWARYDVVDDEDAREAMGRLEGVYVGD